MQDQKSRIQRSGFGIQQKPSQIAASKLGYDVGPDPSPEEAFFIRSDQYSFVRQRIPAVALFA